MSTALPTIMPTRGRWREGYRKFPAWTCSSPKPILFSLIPMAPELPATRWSMLLHQRGVLLAMMDGRIRACTHLDVTAGMIEETVGLVREIVRGV